MPELPEVETTRRVLEERLKGLQIISCEIIRPGFNHKTPPQTLKDAAGAKIAAVRRRGKYLILVLSNGKELIMHLGMSGRIAIDVSVPHIRFQLKVGNLTVNFQDPRRFGRVGCILPLLGPEPLSTDFTPEYFYREIKSRKAPIKAVLMDQATVAGIGNIYATEALFAAGIRPARISKNISRAQSDKLYAAIKEVLDVAVKAGGSTLEDESFLDPLGRPGKFQNHVNVYGRKVGRCGHPLKATPKPIASRTSLYCPVCQK